ISFKNYHIQFGGTVKTHIYLLRLPILQGPELFVFPTFPAFTTSYIRFRDHVFYPEADQLRPRDENRSKPLKRETNENADRTGSYFSNCISLLRFVLASRPDCEY